MEITIIILIFVIIVMIIDKIMNKKQNTTNQTEEISQNNIDYSSLYQKREYILTQDELKFYKLLKYVTDRNNLVLLTQVSLYGIIKNKEFKDFNKIKSKSIDFVITDINTKIIMCIELDGTDHLREDRQKRDIFVNELFKQLDIKLIRIPVQNWYDMKNIEQKIKESL